jgi:glycerol-1-phosphate dehydrogenase [NAD(P)+]
MSALNQVAHLPAFFRIGRGLLDQAAQMVRSAGIDSARIVILSGRHFSRQVAHEIASHLPPAVKMTFFEVPEASDAAVTAVATICQQFGASMLLSVGGGSVVDVGKRVHRLFNIPNIAFPTIISNDGLISPISVLRGPDGHRNSFPAAVPVGVAVDLDIIRRSPTRYLVAAAGDVLSNLSASRDWMRLFKASQGAMQFNDLAYELALGAAESLINLRSTDFADDLFLTSVVRAQVYSGLAMSLAGSSRPCSGAEHLLSHAIDHLELANDELHGIQVGSISLFVLSLLSDETGVAIDFARSIGLPLDWETLSPKVEASVRSVIENARLMRPDRRTILDDFSDDQLLAESRAFVRVVRRGV